MKRSSQGWQMPFLLQFALLDLQFAARQGTGLLGVVAQDLPRRSEVGLVLHDHAGIIGEMDTSAVVKA